MKTVVPIEPFHLWADSGILSRFSNSKKSSDADSESSVSEIRWVKMHALR